MRSLQSIIRLYLILTLTACIWAQLEPVEEQPTTSAPPENATSDDMPEVMEESYICAAAGDFSNAQNCHSYHSCALTLAGQLEHQENQCPPGKAFSVDLNRCGYDLSTCKDTFQCPNAGTFADAGSNTSYYWCVAHLAGGGYHLYHVQCATGQVYVPLLGGCYWNLNVLETMSLANEEYVENATDLNLIKMELKELKSAEKLQLKEEKLKEKLAKKMEKMLLKNSLKSMA